MLRFAPFHEGGWVMMMYGLLAFALSVACTWFVRALAHRMQIVDRPTADRKRHDRSVALLGGLAIMAAFWLSVGISAYSSPDVLFQKITMPQLLACLLATCGIAVVGFLDDCRGLTARTRFLATLGIALAPVMGGVRLLGITHPLGGMISLATPLFTVPGLTAVAVVGDIVVFCWLMGMMYTTKLLDGLDGLATGIVAIGGGIIVLLTRTVTFFQPGVGIVALMFTASCLGFLVFNRRPASIFLGETGSLFVGFMLGILSVISGGKIATALLVMAVPVFDVARVMLVRLRRGQSLSMGDREHLHYVLLDHGWKEQYVVGGMYALAAALGVGTLVLPSYGKMLMLVGLFGGMSWVAWRSARVVS